MPSDLEAWEEKNGKIPDDIILLLFFDWGKRWPDKLTYLGTDTNDTSLLHFPGKLIYTITSFFFLCSLIRGCYRYPLQTSAWVDNTLLPSSLYMHYSSSCTTRPFFVLSFNSMLMRQSRGRCALGEMKRGFLSFPTLSFPSSYSLRCLNSPPSAFRDRLQITRKTTGDVSTSSVHIIIITIIIFPSPSPSFFLGSR